MKNAACCALGFALLCAVPAHAEENSAAEKALMQRQKVEWKKFYGSAQGGAEMPQTSLAIDFFNQAVEAFQAHDHELAREALAESLKLHARNPFAYELLGDIAEEEHRLDEAKENYRQAYLLAPSAKLQEKMEKLGREITQDADFLDFEQGRFLIKSKESDAESIKKLSAELQSIYQKLARDSGISKTKAPAWIHEGLAVHMENQVQARDLTVLRLAVKTRSLLPLDELMSETRPSKQNDALYAELFYEQAFSLADYLIRTYGMFKIRKILEAFADGKNYDEAIRGVLEIDLLQLEEAWKISVIKRFPQTAAETSGVIA